MRKDLNMRRGKQIVQGSHASMKVLEEMGQAIQIVADQKKWDALEKQAKKELKNEKA